MDPIESHQILLVEDDQALAEMVVKFLSEHHFSVEHESRGDRAIRHILERQPGLVLLDVTLPGADGLTVCRAVREQYGGVIVMLTAQCDEKIEVAGFEVAKIEWLLPNVEVAGI